MQKMNNMHFKNLILFFLIAIVSLGATAGDKTNFVTPDGRLSFWSPVKPVLKEDKLQSQTGAPYRRTSYLVETANGMLLAGVLDFRDDLSTTGDEKSYLDTMLQSMRKGFGPGFVLDKQSGQSDLQLANGGLKGREINGNIDGQKIRIRAFVGSRSIFMMQTVHPTNDKQGADISAKFLESFAVDVSK